MTYYSTANKNVHFIIILVRGLYGALCGIIMNFLSALNFLSPSLLHIIFKDFSSYFTWIFLPIFYIPTIAIAKLFLKVNTKFDIIARGFSVYSASTILTYTILSSS